MFCLVSTPCMNFGSIRTRVLDPLWFLTIFPLNCPCTVQYSLSLPLLTHASSVLVLLLSICYGLRLPVHLNRVGDYKKDMGRYSRGMPIYYLPPFFYTVVLLS